MSQEDLLKLSTDDQVSYWIGRALVAIGKGQLHECVFSIIDFYSRVGYERGRKSMVK